LADVLEGRDPDHEKARIIGADWIFINGSPPIKVK